MEDTSECEQNELGVGMGKEMAREVDNAESYGFPSIDSPHFQTVDTAILEGNGIGNKTTEEEIETLNDQVERHISNISRWIHSAHTLAERESYWWRGFSGPASTIRKKLMSKGFNSDARGAREKPHSTIDGAKKEEEEEEEKKAPCSPVSDKRFPPMVEIPPKIEASFRGLDECLLTASKIKTTDELKGSKLVKSIVERVAQEPSLLKTILLIHKKDDLKRILSCKIVKRVMLCPFSVMHEDELRKYKAPTRGIADKFKDSESSEESMTNIFVADMNIIFSPTKHKRKIWLTRMLENGYGPIKKTAVDYFELLSKLTVADYVLDEDANPTPVHIDMFHQSREEIFSTIENLHYLVPAMISLEDSEQERAAVTQVIRQVLDNAVVRPFEITLLFCDLVFHIFIVFGWRSIAFRLVDVADNDPTDEQRDDHFHRFIQSMFVISAVYFSWRLFGEIFSSMVTSWRVFRTNFRTIWTLVDVASIVIAYISFRKINADGTKVYSHAWFRLFAILTGLLWLKLLSFLKVMNPSLATFVLAIIQIIKDAKWIVLILVIVTLAFGDMFFIIMKTDPDFCPAEGGNDNPYCDFKLSYLDAFVQILGQFDYGSFLGRPITVVLFIIMTVFGAIIFLNILIAVVSDSYNEATLNSARLFGRARILMVAKITQLEHIMEPKWLNRTDRPHIRILKILFKFLTIFCFVHAIYWLLMFSVRIENGGGSTAGAVVATCMMVVFLVAAFLGLTFFITGWGENRKYPKLRKLNDNIVITWIYWKPMVFLTKLVLGLAFKKQVHERYDEEDEWSERMIHIGSVINHSVDTSESRLVDIITSLKTELKESEMQRTMETEALKESLASLSRDNHQQRALLENMITKMAAAEIPNTEDDLDEAT